MRGKEPWGNCEGKEGLRGRWEPIKRVRERYSKRGDRDSNKRERGRERGR